jgi:hypothetical protein
VVEAEGVAVVGVVGVVGAAALGVKAPLSPAAAR